MKKEIVGENLAGIETNEAMKQLRFTRLLHPTLLNKWQIFHVARMNSLLNDFLTPDVVAECCDESISNERALHRLRQELIHSNNNGFYNALLNYCEQMHQALADVVQSMSMEMNAAEESNDDELTPEQFDALIKFPIISKLSFALDVKAMKEDLAPFLSHTDVEHLCSLPNNEEAVTFLHRKLLLANRKSFFNQIARCCQKQNEKVNDCLEFMTKEFLLPEESAQLFSEDTSSPEASSQRVTTSNTINSCCGEVVELVTKLRQSIMEQCNETVGELETRVNNITLTLTNQQSLHNDTLNKFFVLVKENEELKARIAQLENNSPEMFSLKKHNHDEDSDERILQMQKEVAHLQSIINKNETKIRDLEKNNERLSELEHRNTLNREIIQRLQEDLLVIEEMEQTIQIQKDRIQEFESSSAKKTLQNVEEDVIEVSNLNTVTTDHPKAFKLWPSFNLIHAIQNFKIKGLPPTLCDDDGNYENINWHTLGGIYDWSAHWVKIKSGEMFHPLYFPPLLLPMEYGECVIWLNLALLQEELVLRGRTIDADRWVKSPLLIEVTLQILITVGEEIITDVVETFAFSKEESKLLTVRDKIKREWPIPAVRVKVLPLNET